MSAKKLNEIIVSLPEKPTDAELKAATDQIMSRTNFTPVHGSKDMTASVDIRVMRPDPAYQRNTDTSKDQITGANFDISKCGHVIVSYRDGRIWVIDGWHRIRAALEAGITHLMAWFINGFDGLTQKEEAKRFYEQDDKNIPVGIMDKHKSALIFGEEVHTMLQDFCDKYSLTLIRSGRRTGAYVTSPTSILTIMQYLKNKGGIQETETFCEWLFGIYERAGWITKQWTAVAFNAKFVNALAEMYKYEYNRVNAKRYDPAKDEPSKLGVNGTFANNLARVLSEVTPENIEIYAQSQRLELGKLGLNASDVRTVIREIMTQIAEEEITANMIRLLQHKLK